MLRSFGGVLIDPVAKAVDGSALAVWRVGHSALGKLIAAAAPTLTLRTLKLETGVSIQTLE